MSSRFTVLKLFDCQAMPEEVRRAFLDQYNTSNDVIVSWNIEKNIAKDPQRALVNRWLLEAGAQEGERVLVEHWW